MTICIAYNHNNVIYFHTLRFQMLQNLSPPVPHTGGSFLVPTWSIFYISLFS